MTARLALIAALVFAFTAAPAGAAVVSQSTGPAYADGIGDDGFDGCSRYMQCGTLRAVLVNANPGERNSITTSIADPANPLTSPITVRDFAGGPLTAAAGSNCVVTAPSEVTCATAPPGGGQDGAFMAQAIVSLGDGDDSVTAGNLALTATGGPGADILTAVNATATAVFHGDEGDDTLHGGAQNDYLYGDDGRDHLYGGASFDLLSGGDGNDELFGQLGGDDERGGNGRDLIDGGSGDDRLSGGRGRDALLGRTGADRLSSRDNAADRVSCGSGKGRDRAVADRKDKISGCEKRSVK